MNRSLFAFIGVLFVCGCSSPLQEDEFDGGVIKSQPVLHAIQDQELRELMGRMNALMLERFMTEHEMDVERRKYTRQIIDAAALLNNTADSLIHKMPELNLTAAEQKAFSTLAVKLGQSAQLLSKQAEHNALTAIPETLHDMKSTCMACHTLFRKF